MNFTLLSVEFIIFGFQCGISKVDATLIFVKMNYIELKSSIAQLVEQSAVNRSVVGSNPTWRVFFKNYGLIV